MQSSGCFHCSLLVCCLSLSLINYFLLFARIFRTLLALISPKHFFFYGLACKASVGTYVIFELGKKLLLKLVFTIEIGGLRR